MSKLRVLDLFSGIGGFSLGLERTGGFETVAFCEIEPFPRRVLAKHWPDVRCYHDVTELTGDILVRDGIAVDVITGGFPCQDLSCAGKQRGMGEGTRSGLWSEIVRLIGELRPRYLILENVSDLLVGPSERRGGWFGRVLGDLAALGFDAEWHCIPASYVGAPHIRDRAWVIANPKRERGQAGEVLADFIAAQRFKAPVGQFGGMDGAKTCAEAISRFCRADDGVPADVDRLTALGNSVVPQIPELIGRAILAAEMMEPA